jgi:pimeloyl-ACP methyl ester carboxylesterase
MLGAPLLSGVLALASVTGAPATNTFAPATNTPTAATTTATAALTFTPCTSEAARGFSCTTLSVPLERGGAVGGNVDLSVERLDPSSARPVPSKAAVVALAGGPGQAALPLALGIAKTIAPALATRDLLVFDQRGTGSSGPLFCSALEGVEALNSIGQAFERCAEQIGPQRGAYTTQESVADIEALRQAAGYEKLVLFGVSYGTKVALEYAERYPQNVEALVLDSVVPPERADPFSVGMFQAMKPVFEELCSAGACAGITANPLDDVARLAAHLHKHALSGWVYDGSGHRQRATLSNVALLNLIGAGELNPALRALLPASVQSALRGDPAPLLRLNLLSEGLIPNLPGAPFAMTQGTPDRSSPGALTDASFHTTPFLPTGATRGSASARWPEASSDGIDEALFVDTTCEESSLPWQRAAAPKTRLAEGLAALRGLPAADFYPFDASTAWADSVLPGCMRWPNEAPPSPPVGTLPSVPTLILSGAQDLRTPTASAESVAARIPGAQLVIVPYTGHSVLGTDFSGCAQTALKDFFSSETAQRCGTIHNPFGPTPITPSRLTAVKPVGGLAGTAGSTLAVVLDTILDLERQVVGATLQADQELPSGSSFGGLRGGYAQITSSALRLHRLSFVNGVQITGSFQVVRGHLRPAELRVEGSRAANGTVRVGASASVSGTLGGRHFDVSLAKVRLARAGAAMVGTAMSELPLDLRFPVPRLSNTP